MKVFWLVGLIFFLGVVLRFISIYPHNTIIGFDQARDLFDARQIFLSRHPRIIGPTAGNNPNLRHGVAYLYYILPPLLLFGGNPVGVALYNSLFNAALSLVLFFLGRALFDNKTGLISALLGAVSYQIIQYSGWLSNPSPTILTVPLFFWGVVSYCQGKRWGLLLAALGLGLSIELELFFIYLIPTAFLLWLALKPAVPSLKLIIGALITFTAVTSTMIATEFKFHLGGVVSIMRAGDLVGGPKTGFLTLLGQFLGRFGEGFSLNIWPNHLKWGWGIGFLILGVLFYQLVKGKKAERWKIYLPLIYLFSPAVMLFLGYHDSPWFLIGLPPAIALSAGFALSKLNLSALLPILLLIAWANVNEVVGTRQQGQVLLGPDPSALLSSQLAAVDYTYQSSQGQKFTINSVTNPLYINAVWAYHYDWYGGRRYGFLPTWAGGDQLHPYDVLPKSNGQEKFLYLLIDQSERIPLVHKIVAKNWADERSGLLEEKTFGGILVQKRELIYQGSQGRNQF